MGKYRGLYGSGAYAPKEYRKWLGAKVKPLIRQYGLEHGQTNPAARDLRTRALRPGALIASELPLLGTQPTLF